MPHKEIKDYVSVTQVIGVLDKPWKWNWYRAAVKKDGHNGWLKCDQTSALGREDGTAFHAEIEAYLVNSVPMSRFKPWQEWYDRGNFNPLLIEPNEPFQDPKLKLQGTPDYIENMDGTPVVWDWKYAKQLSEDYGLQLAAYTYLFGRRDGLDEDEIFEHSPFGMVGWQNKETNQVKAVKYEPLEKYWRVFKGLIPAAHYLRGIGEWE